MVAMTKKLSSREKWELRKQRRREIEQCYREFKPQQTRRQNRLPFTGVLYTSNVESQWCPFGCGKRFALGFMNDHIRTAHR